MYQIYKTMVSKQWTSREQKAVRDKKQRRWEFPGGLVIGIPGFHCCGLGSVPGRGTEILQAMQCSQKQTNKKPHTHKICFYMYYILHTHIHMYMHSIFKEYLYSFWKTTETSEI